MATTYMLTTIDNPYNPFEDFHNWFRYDETNGYRSCEKLASLCHVNDSMSNDEVREANEKAIDILVENDFTGLYRKVSETTAKDLVEKRVKTPKFYTKLDNGELT